MSANPGKARTAEPVNHNFLSRTTILGKPTILIVEDDDDTRELLRTLYEMWEVE